MGEPGGKERAEARKTAIGLQAVDGLKTSEYLNETADTNNKQKSKEGKRRNGFANFFLFISKNQ